MVNIVYRAVEVVRFYVDRVKNKDRMKKHKQLKKAQINFENASY
jgi:hypothetical protein